MFMPGNLLLCFQVKWRDENGTAVNVSVVAVKLGILECSF